MIMLDIIAIAEKVMAIKEQWKDCNIWEILDRLGVIYDFADFGSAHEGLKGYCTSFFNQFFMAISIAFPEYLQELLAWHELGPIILSPELLQNGNFLCDSNLSLAVDRAELAANYFAAEAMIEDDDLIPLIKSGNTVQSAAAILKVPSAFVSLKCEILIEYGYKLRIQEMPDSHCLGEDILGLENI